MKTILLFGGTGTLGSELVNYIKTFEPSINLIIKNHKELDITQYNMLYNEIQKIHTITKIDFIINCAAIVNTVGIESDINIKNNSYMTNALAPKYLSYICNKLNIKLIHFSTDYIFSEKSNKSYNGYDEFPINQYGYHKLIGELFIKNNMNKSNYLIARIGWVYGQYTKRSFIHKFIKNVCNKMKTMDDVYVVDDQISTPTSVLFISKKICEIIHNNQCGVCCISPSKSSTKYEYAKKILHIINTKYDMDIFNNVNVFKSKTNQQDVPYPLNSTLNMYHCINSDEISWEQDLIEYMELNKDKFINFIYDCLK